MFSISFDVFQNLGFAMKPVGFALKPVGGALQPVGFALKPVGLLSAFCYTTCGGFFNPGGFCVNSCGTPNSCLRLIFERHLAEVEPGKPHAAHRRVGALPIIA